MDKNKIDFDKLEDHSNPVYDNIEFTRELEINNSDELSIKQQSYTTVDDTDELATMEVDIKKLQEEIEAFSDEKTKEVLQDTIDFSENPENFLTESEEELIYQKKILERKNRHLKIITIFLVVILTIIVVIALIYSSSDAIFVRTNNNNLIMLDSIEVYGESVNTESDEPIRDVQLYNRDTKEYIQMSIDEGIDQQIKFDQIDYGSYYLFINGKLAELSYNPKVVFQTINRDYISKKVSITTGDNNIVNINISESVSDQVDIIIDPSQGGVQGYVASDGTTTEQQLSMEYAFALKTSLEEMGYNVQLTRYIDQVPGDCETDDLYCQDGRIAQAYSSGAKIYIALGFAGSNSSGFEIIDSYQSSHELARDVKTYLSNILTPRVDYNLQVEPGIINKTYKDSYGQDVDYSYYIRETGGSIMNSDNQQAAALNDNPVGTETLQINLGYIGNERDFEQLNDSEEITEITEQIATGIDYYIVNN